MAVITPHTMTSPNLRRPVLPGQPTSLAAATAQRHHPRPSLAVLAIGTVSVPVRGPAHRFQSLELDRPQISKKPSVTKPSLLQLHFKTHHGISHPPSLVTQVGISESLLNRGCGPLTGDLGEDTTHADLVQKQGNHQFYIRHPETNTFMYSVWQH